MKVRPDFVCIHPVNFNYFSYYRRESKQDLRFERGSKKLPKFVVYIGFPNREPSERYAFRHHTRRGSEGEALYRFDEGELLTLEEARTRSELTLAEREVYNILKPIALSRQTAHTRAVEKKKLDSQLVNTALTLLQVEGVIISHDRTDRLSVN